MSEDSHHQDWDPRADAVLDDQLAAYDTMRRRCPVAFSDYMQWSLFRYADVRRVLEDHATFSNAVSRHLSVPNAMNPPEHARFRRLIEPYFAPGPMRDFEPLCRDIADKLVDALPAEGEIEVMADLGQPFALQVQCTFMGWPDELHAPLQDWVTRQQAATLAGDREALSGLAQEFDSVIRGLLEERRLAGAQAPDDVTTRLMRERVDGRTLSDEETISIIRNWTAGELGTISACVGILLRYLAEHTDLQMRLRREPELLPAAIEEILRMDAPLMSNRRIATCPVTLGGRRIEAGERLTVLWGSANRDEAVFGDPDAFRLDRDPDLNLLYGAGIHVCPGAPLARMELRLFLQALLDRTQVLAAVADKPAVRAHFPAGGYSRVWTQVQR